MGGFSQEVAALEAAYAELLKIAEQLGTEELQVLTEVANGLLWGQTHYGFLDLANDKRDFRKEAGDEDRDWLAYRAMDLVRQRKRK